MNNVGNLINRATLPLCRQYVAIDITPTEIRMVSIRRDKVEKWSSAPLREGMIKDGIIVSPQDLSLLLEDLFTSLALPRSRVVCTITGLPFSYRTIVMPDANGSIVQEAIERAARKEMSINEPDMYIFWKAVLRHPEKKETDCFVVAVPKIAVRPLADALAKAQVKQYELDIKPLALARLASAPSAVIISLEKKYIDVVVVADGSVKTLYSFPPLNAAGDRDRIAVDVVNGLDKTLNSYNHDYPGSPLPADLPILVSGELANDSAMLARLTELSGHPVLPFETPVVLPTDFSLASYAANLGLILKKSPLKQHLAGLHSGQYKDIDVNLFSGLPKKGLRINISQAAAVLSAVLLLSLIYYAYDLRHDAGLRVNLLNTEKEATAVKLLVLEKTNQDYQAAQKDRSAALQKLKGEADIISGAQQFFNNARLDCARDMSLVIAMLPAEAQYDTINVSKGGIETSGQAAEVEDVLWMVDKLEADSHISQSRVASIQPSSDPESTRVAYNISIKRK
jgi:hypothetical protein